MSARKSLASIVLAAIACLALSVPSVRAADVDFVTWLAELKADAAKQGIRPATLDRALNGLKPIPRVVELDRKQPEFTLTFDQYLNRVVPQSRVDQGRAKLRENKAILEEIGKKYGVQPRFIVAFWGIESDFGRLDGGFSVIQSLATLAYDGRRSKFFRAELIRALRIVDQGHIAPDAMRGSWAGAMGHFQFMPSTFESFAVDHDGDGKRNIWSNKLDAFASAANYLSRSGWKGDQTWGRAVKLPAGFDRALAGLETKKSISEWQKLGVTRSDGRPLPQADITGSIVLASGDAGPAFLVYDNYRVTLKWNRSTFFAVAVGTLAERIGDI